MKDIELKINNTNISPHSEIKGNIVVNYPGRYDGVVINIQILGSNELVVYSSYNEKKISQNVSRLFISKDSMPDNKAEFTASIEFEPKETHEVKFRVSIIEQHKEIESAVVFAKFASESQQDNFVPKLVNIQLGIDNHLIWVNDDDVAHTVTPDHRAEDSYSGPFGSSGVILPGESYEFLFTESTEVPYHCEPHPWMTGTLIITKQRF